MTNQTAYLSSDGNYTIFRCGRGRLKFLAPRCLVRYHSVKNWRDGCIVVDTEYSHERKLVEEYIDLAPVFEMLRLDAHEYLRGIEKVEVCYG